MTQEQMNAIIERMEGKPGDLLLFAADQTKLVWSVLGALRLEIADELGLRKPDEYKFLWITEFPLLSGRMSRTGFSQCTTHLQ